MFTESQIDEIMSRILFTLTHEISSVYPDVTKESSGFPTENFIDYYKNSRKYLLKELNSGYHPEDLKDYKKKYFFQSKKKGYEHYFSQNLLLKPFYKVFPTLAIINNEDLKDNIMKFLQNHG